MWNLASVGKYGWSSLALICLLISMGFFQTNALVYGIDHLMVAPSGIHTFIWVMLLNLWWYLKWRYKERMNKVNAIMVTVKVTIVYFVIEKYVVKMALFPPTKLYPDWNSGMSF